MISSFRGDLARGLALAAVAVLVVGACQSEQAPSASTQAAPATGPVASAPGGGVGASAAQGIDAAIQDLSKGLIFPQQPTPFSYQQRDMVPVASKITLSPLAPDGTITVTGAPGAIPAVTLGSAMHDVVEVTSLDTLTGACAPAGRDGAFSVRLSSGPGATLVVTARSPDTCTAQGPLTSAGAVLRVPDGTTPGPTLPFRLAAFNGEFHWTATGELLGAGASMELGSDDIPRGRCFVPRLQV